MKWKASEPVRSTPLVVLVAVASMLLPTGNSVAECEIPPAAILAFEAAETLHPDPTYLAMFEDHLSQIEDAYPFFGTICPWYSNRLGEVVVVLTDEAREQWEAGEYTGWDALNEQFNAIVDPGPPPYQEFRDPVVRFDPLLHPTVVATAYMEVEGVLRAFPNAIGTFNCDPTDVTYIEPASYEYYLVDDPLHCLARWWVIEITPEGPVVVRGWPIPTPGRANSWGALKSRFR